MHIDILLYTQFYLSPAWTEPPITQLVNSSPLTVTPWIITHYELLTLQTCYVCTLSAKPQNLLSQHLSLISMNVHIFISALIQLVQWAKSSEFYHKNPHTSNSPKIVVILIFIHTYHCEKNVRVGAHQITTQTSVTSPTLSKLFSKALTTAYNHAISVIFPTKVTSPL